MENIVTAENFLPFATKVVKHGQGILGQAFTFGWMKTDGSYASKRDLESENSLATEVHRVWPEMAILKEEEATNPSPRRPRPVIPARGMFASIDGLDGTSEYLAGRRAWSVSVGIIHRNKPIAGVVVQPALARAYATAPGLPALKYDYALKSWRPFERKPAPRPVLGVDLDPNSPEEYEQEIFRLRKRYRMRPTNLPAVAAGIEIAEGSAFVWHSHTAHHWDLAAIRLILQRVGCVAECIDGKDIPWRKANKLPPVLLAADRATADEVRMVITPPEIHRQKIASSEMNRSRLVS